MKPADYLPVVAALTLAYGVYRMVQAGREAANTVTGWVGAAGEWVSDAAGAVAALPGELVDGTSPISDPNAPGFVKTSTTWDGYVPNWSGNRDVSPLVAYFKANGNTVAARNQATASGWTQDEISAAVSVLFWSQQE